MKLNYQNPVKTGKKPTISDVVEHEEDLLFSGEDPELTPEKSR